MNRTIIDSAEKLIINLGQDKNNTTLTDAILVIDAQVFIEVMSSGYRHVVFSKCDIDIQGLPEYNCRSIDVKLSFQNCNFKSDLHISKLGIKSDIIISKCDFCDNNLEITNLSSRVDATHSYKIQITECRNIRLLRIKDIRYNDKFTIEVRKTHYSNIEYRNNGCDAAMILFNNNNDDSYYFINKFTEKYFIELNKINTNSSSFIYENCSFNSPIIMKNKIYNSLNFIECIFEEKLHIEEVELDDIIFEGCKFKGSAKIFNLQKPLNRAVFTYCTIEGLFIFNGWYGGVLNFQHKDTEIDFTNVFIKKDAYLIIKNVNIYADKEHNKNRITRKHNGIFNFSNSNILGDVVFNNVCAKEINLDGAAIVGNFNVENIDIKKHANRATCVKLKNEFNKRNDNISALKYKSKEMAKYWNEVYTRKQCFILKIPEYFLLSLNLISNGYGRWWLQGVLYTFSTAFIFYTIYHFTLAGNDTVWFPSIDKWLIFDPEYIKNVLSYLWVLDTSWLKELNDNNTATICSYIWYILGKIFVGYGIYQTISAFRKYGK